MPTVPLESDTAMPPASLSARTEARTPDAVYTRPPIVSFWHMTYQQSAATTVVAMVSAALEVDVPVFDESMGVVW